MTKSQINKLSKEELFELSLKRYKNNKYTANALYAQELLYTEMFRPNEVSRENLYDDWDPFRDDDLDPFYGYRDIMRFQPHIF